MPDASHPFPNSAAHDWSGAFNALPPEAPPADGWARLATRLDARRKPRRVAAWVGLAAAAAVVAVIAWPRESPVAGTTSAGAMEVASQEAVIPREAAGSDNSVAVAADPTRTDVAAVAAAAAPARKDVVASTVPARAVATRPCRNDRL